MSENIRQTVGELPFGHQARKGVADQILEARRIDRTSRNKLSQSERRNRSQEYMAGMISRPEKDWTNNRKGREYVRCLQGLEATFQYIRGLESNFVLDIGTGTSEGISDIAKSDLGKGLEFKGTSVTPQPEFKRYLGQDKILITSAESLRGVERNSVAGILALHSLAYSAEPQYVVARLDQVLIEGGVVKLLAYHDEVNKGRLGEKTITPFLVAFRDMGYDVEVSEDKTILLAIKPCKDKSSSATLAKNLIEQDKASMQQYEDLLDRQKEAEDPI